MRVKPSFGVRRRVCGAFVLVFALSAPPSAGAAGFAAPSHAERQAIARVALAEAADQGDSGLAAVIFVILNRLASRRWGDQVDALLNARGQFEPVLRAGGDWRRLPPPTEIQQARIDTIINLASEGRLTDPTKGAEYFQNPRLVADRINSGALARNVFRFGGRKPTAVIGQHEFFLEDRTSSGRPPSARAENGSIFITSLPGCLDRCLETGFGRQEAP